MKASAQFVAIVAVGAALALAACGGGNSSPVASTAVVTGESGSVTSSGYGPGAPSPAPSPGSGTCTNECDGTGQGPGPGYGPGNGGGNGYGYGYGGGGNGYGPGPGPMDGFCGDACTGPVGPDPEDIGAILVDALQEEYMAQYLYASVLEDFPGAVPFAVIVESEKRHVEALQQLFTRRQMAPPPSTWTTSSFDPFASIPAACAGGVKAETEDAAFYTPYLKRDDLPQDVRTVMTNLQRASLENHLPAFQACAQ
jgi:hypothetical protein